MLFFIWADEKYNTQKNPCVVFATQKNPSVSHRPKKIPFGQNFRPKKILRTPPSLKYVSGAQQRFIFYTPKNPNFRICLPKKIPTFFSITKKIPQCFCISKFHYSSSGKLKHANFNFGFGQNKTIIALMLLLIWSVEKYNTQKNLCVVFATQKNPGVFHRPQKIPFGQNVRPKKILWSPPTSLKYVSGVPGVETRPVSKIIPNVSLTRRVSTRALW